MGPAKARAMNRLVGTFAAALVFAPLLAVAQPRPDACEHVPPAESVGRLLDSLSSLLRAIPQPAKSRQDAARERVAALKPETARNAHFLSTDLRDAFPMWSPVETVSRRNAIAARMRVDLPLSDSALLAFLETGLVAPSAEPSGFDLGDTVSRGTLRWSDHRDPAPGAVLTLKPHATGDRTLIASGRSLYDWQGGPAVVLHRVLPGPMPPKPQAFVLGPLSSPDVESIALPAGPAWDERAAKLAARYPGIAVTRTAAP